VYAANIVYAACVCAFVWYNDPWCRHQKANYGLLNLAVLNKCSDNSEVSYESCLAAGHMTKLHIKKGTSVTYAKQLVKVSLLLSLSRTCARPCLRAALHVRFAVWSALCIVACS
jgi:hypothetical protein